MNFTVQEIEDRDSVGYFLKKEREKQDLSLADISKKILVAEHYLEYLEEDKFSYLPGEVYLKNFLKRYVEFLGFSFEEVMENFSEKLDFEKIWSGKPKQPRLPLSLTNFITWPKVVKATVVSVIAMMVFGYLGFTAYKFMEPPNLTVFNPQDKIVIQGGNILIEGETDRSAKVTINQDEVVVEDGFFTQELDLQPGINEISIIATKKHGRFTEVKRQVIVAELPGDISKN